ncbi:hypothetical protein Tco_1263690, partial [Tanacetum coccineum]
EEINALARKGKKRGHLPGVGRVLPVWAKDVLNLFRSDDKFSKMLNQYESTPEFSNGSGGCGDDEMADNEDGGEDEEDKEDGDIVMYPEKIWKLPAVHAALKKSRPIPGDMSPWKVKTNNSLGKVARESISGELSSATYPGRHVASQWYPQRQVAWEVFELSLGIVANVVVTTHEMP